MIPPTWRPVRRPEDGELVGHLVVVRLPAVLPRGLVTASRPAEDLSWRAVGVVEASPVGCRVRPERPASEEPGGQTLLTVPVGDLLRLEPPA